MSSLYGTVGASSSHRSFYGVEQLFRSKPCQLEIDLHRYNFPDAQHIVNTIISDLQNFQQSPGQPNPTQASLTGDPQVAAVPKSGSTGGGCFVDDGKGHRGILFKVVCGQGTHSPPGAREAR